jgi:hypothetical protein
MVQSLSNSMIVTHDHAAKLFPSIHPQSLIAALDATKHQN